MSTYRQMLQNYKNTILTVGGGSGLFGVGTIDHVEDQQ
jgi:hypothetical protein